MEGQQRKLTHGLLRSLASLEDQAQQLPVIVKYVPERRVMRHAEPLRGARESYRYRLRPFVHMHATPAAIQQLELDPQVLMIYEDRPVRAYLDTALPLVHVPRLHAEGLAGDSVRIAIVDTGIDPTHPDFAGRIAANTDFTGEGLVDRNGHGTHCAGIAAGTGIASGLKYRGAAPKALLYIAKVLRASGDGMMSDVMAGVEWAVLQGVQIISLSLGGPGPCDGSDALCETCDAAVQAGVAVCVAAGNDGPEPYTIGSPGGARNVITVGAVTDQDRVATFSARGPTVDGRPKPDVVTPGVNIIAPRAQGTSMGQPVDQHYTMASGTSMATPLLAGIGALLLQAEPRLKPDELKSRLMTTATDLNTSPYAQGRGRVDAWRARHGEVQPAPTPQPEPVPPPPTPGQGCLPVALRALFWGLPSRRRKP